MIITGVNKIANAGGLGYLMSCYSKHPDGLDYAADEVTEWAARLMEMGLVVYAPITYGHAISPKFKNFPKEHHYSHELWLTICERFWSHCDYGIVLMNKNWGNSEGIAVEVADLLRTDRIVYFLDPERGRILHLAELMEEQTKDNPDAPFADFVKSLKMLSRAKHTSGGFEAAKQWLGGRMREASTAPRVLH